MIEYYVVTGDIHGNIDDLFKRVSAIQHDIENGLLSSEYHLNVILLGDVGINFFNNNRDMRAKDTIKRLMPSVNFLLIRGNHDMRPQHLEKYTEIFVPEFGEKVGIEYDFPNIFYLLDGGIYQFNDYRCLVIGGAYSVDKYYRLSQGWTWHSDEQLTDEEKAAIGNKIKFNPYFDFVLSHTCPYEWRPTDLFLPQVDQSNVDISTELWLSEIEKMIHYKYWCFGHYHQDRIEVPGGIQFFKKWADLDYINYFYDDLASLWPHGPHDPDYYIQGDSNYD